MLGILGRMMERLSRRIAEARRRRALRQVIHSLGTYWVVEGECWRLGL